MWTLDNNTRLLPSNKYPFPVVFVREENDERYSKLHKNTVKPDSPEMFRFVSQRKTLFLQSRITFTAHSKEPCRSFFRSRFLPEPSESFPSTQPSSITRKQLTMPYRSNTQKYIVSNQSYQ